MLAAQLADAAEAAVGVAVVVAVAVVMAVAVRATLAAHLASGLEAAESLCWCSEPPTRGAEHRARSPPARAATTTSCECASVASGREASRLSLATHAAVPAARIRVPVLATSAWQARVFPRSGVNHGAPPLRIVAAAKTARITSLPFLALSDRPPPDKIR